MMSCRDAISLHSFVCVCKFILFYYCDYSLTGGGEHKPGWDGEKKTPDYAWCQYYAT